MNRGLCATLLLSLGLLWSAQSSAAISCDVAATGVAFGVYNPLAGADVDTTGNVNVSCTRTGLLDLTPGISYSVQLNPGNSGGYSSRELGSGAAMLNYNLYRNAARTLIWGDGTGGSSAQGGNVSFPLLNLSSVTRDNDHTIYGRIFGGQNVAAGSYTDTINVTVIF